MSFLNLDGGSGSAHIVERLNAERTHRASKSVGFDAVEVNEAILQAAVLLFRDRQQQYQQAAANATAIANATANANANATANANAIYRQAAANATTQPQHKQNQHQHQAYNNASPQQQLNHAYPPHQPFTIDSGGWKPIPTRVVHTHPASSNKSNNKNSNNNHNSNIHSNVNIHNNVKLEKLCINNCPANPFLEYLIEASMGMDLFREFELQGNMEEEEQAAELAAEATTTRRGASGEHDGDEQHDPGSPNTTAPQQPQQQQQVSQQQHNSNNNNTNIFALDALGFRMRFSKRLRRVELINLPITRDHAESLMYGIETNEATLTGCRLDTLVMEGVRFVDDIDDMDDDGMDDVDEEEDEHETDEDDTPEATTAAAALANTNPNPAVTPGDGTVVVRELCEGFPNNRTLTTIKLERCKLTDAQIALVFGSLARHPTLKHLNLSENSCRNLGLEALDKMLVSPPPLWMPEAVANANMNANDSKMCCCKIESLDLSYQFTSEETYGTGEHIQLDILTRNCTLKDADIRIYPNLRTLVLQGNQIDDSDTADLAFLIRHRFPQLEELDLRFNEITTEGLELFANHSDPNHDLYLACGSNDTNNTYNNNKTDSPNSKNSTTSTYKNHVPPPSSRLRTIRLTNNPLVMTHQTSIVILKLLKIYPELQLIQSNLEWDDGSPIAEYIQHLLDINRAGRVLLLAGNSSNGDTDHGGHEDDSSPGDTHTHRRAHERGIITCHHSVPQQLLQLPTEEKQRRRQQRQQERRPLSLGAWPLVLARLTRQSRYPHYIPVKNSLNGMYYLIRHGPIIVEQQQQQQMVQRSSPGIGGGTANGSSSHNPHTNRTSGSSNNNNNNNTSDRDQSRKRKWGDPALGGYATLADFLRCELGAKSKSVGMMS